MSKRCCKVFVNGKGPSSGTHSFEEAGEVLAEMRGTGAKVSIKVDTGRGERDLTPDEAARVVAAATRRFA